MLLFRMATLLSLLTGCPYVFSPPDLNNVDADGDGFGEANGDCNDSDATIFPDAPELCDGLRNNCLASNGLADDEVDDDGDGYVECAIDRRGWQGFAISGGGDCDDTNDVIGQRTFPGVAAKDGLDCLKDLDMDEYGDANPKALGVGAGSDCNDDSSAVFPGGLESDIDGLDNNCDSVIDHIWLKDAFARFDGIAPYDQAGQAVAGVGDINGDSYGDFAVGSSRAGLYAGEVYLILGSGGLSSASLASADARIAGEAPGDSAGYFVSSAGDVDADGYDDLFIGAPAESTAANNAGAAYLVMGSALGVSLNNLSQAEAKLLGEGKKHSAGDYLSSAGDVNGDGLDDLLIGAPGAFDTGAAYLVLG
ncbi:MAG: hypothetical protein HN348_25945, partial [Proteobacteria bacterium]|nr:hypothetical protein [Pseudomonadota bacterium]